MSLRSVSVSEFKLLDSNSCNPRMSCEILARVLIGNILIPAFDDMHDDGMKVWIEKGRMSIEGGRIDGNGMTVGYRILDNG
ncbi:hypothetical protein V1477_002185 [Vespula maculifrons]|uniref:Uncharacterized protein n=2 Tax=Vespula TaxID=7451 RepID=A0A834MTD7_VESVU|nr:hypothetical protein HZH66_013680 [Vespula vulgaris]